MKQARWVCFIIMVSLLLPGVSSAGRSNWALNMVSGVVYIAGFEYNYDQNIYMTRHNALQRKFGFNNLYDKLAAPVGMAIDVEPIRFEFEGQKYMVELWKGQYYSSIGAEIGFYVGTELNIYGDAHYRCANPDEELDIAFTLENDETQEYAVSGRHWWLTGFKPGVFGRPEDLVLKNLEIIFKSEAMAEAFEHELYRLGYDGTIDDVWRDGDTVGFIFSTPKTEQPWEPDQMEVVLRANRGLVDVLKRFQWAFDLEDFSPESIAEVIDKRFWSGMYLFFKFRKTF